MLMNADIFKSEKWNMKQCVPKESGIVIYIVKEFIKERFLIISVSVSAFTITSTQLLQL